MTTAYVTKETFLKMAFDYIPGKKVDAEELDDLIANGHLQVNAEGFIPIPEGLDVVKRWCFAQRPDLHTWDGSGTRPTSGHERQENLSTPSGFGGTNAAAQLEKIVKQKMREDPNLSYGAALSLAQKENPALAAQVSQGLDDFRNRNKK